MPATTAKLRRAPAQERSRAKVRALLDAADRVLAEEGAAAFATTRVAEAAGVSVGTLYQYFEGKEALAEALALHYFHELHDVMRELADRGPLGDPAGELIDAYASAYRARPGFRALWFGGLRTERLRDATRPGRQVVGEHLVRLLAAQAPGASDERRAAVARVGVLIADGLLREAFRVSPEGDEELLDEAKRALRAYLAAELAVGA